jgi:hypothetical protein
MEWTESLKTLPTLPLGQRLSCCGDDVPSLGQFLWHCTSETGGFYYMTIVPQTIKHVMLATFMLICICIYHSFHPVFTGSFSSFSYLSPSFSDQFPTA